MPADVLDRTERSLAFRDINPAAPTHFLVIPIEHLESLGDQVPAETLADMIAMARRLATQEGLDGWRLVSNVGAAAGQSVFHLHMHVMGGRPMAWPPG